MFAAIAKIDAFPKAFDDFRVRTTSGAVVSILSILFVSMLLCSELVYNYKTEVVDHLFVNTTRHSNLVVKFDISFPEISCDLLSIDAVDETGKTMEDTVHNVFKHQLNPHGIKFGAPVNITTLGDTIKTEDDLTKLANKHQEAMKDPEKLCGNCYGAQSIDGQCCNTCADVKTAYEKKGWVFKPVGIDQCSEDTFQNNLREQFAKEGGCQIYGSMEFAQGAGQFHIAPHKKLHTGGQSLPGQGNKVGMFNLMDLISFTFDQFNITHTINSLSFGDHFPGIRSPLDGQSRTVTDTHGMYQYYLKVVPTRYKSRHSGQDEIISNQYAVTEHVSHLAPGSGRGLPGLYFHYEVSPIQAVFEEKRGGALGFLVSACAVAGGLFTVMGLVDRFVGYVIATCFTKNPLV